MCGFSLSNVFVELIDTLWNVNVFPIAIITIVCIELIDTLWNVNERVQKRIDAPLSN